MRNSKYAYEDLSCDQFENLIVYLCQEMLGIGVQTFAKGPDGGRDAKFEGTCQYYPSTTSPWNGIVIIQAKHTNGYNKHFSEPDFYSPSSKSSILSKEIIKIKQLKNKNQLDHYMLFSNRRLPANADANIKQYLSTECNIPESSICLCGIEQLEIWLKRYPNAAKNANIDPIESPLIVSPNDLSDIIYSLADQLTNGLSTKSDPPTPRIPYKDKNLINNMSNEYAEAMRKKYLKETAQIRDFLAAPENLEIQNLYENVVDEFQLKVIAKKKEFHSFDDIMNHLFDLLISRDHVLRKNKKLTRLILFYMYWNCDIGSENYASAN